MSDFFLRTNNKTLMKTALLSSGIEVEGIDGETVWFNGIRIDLGWIGPISQPNPTNPSGPLITDNRFHANMRVSGELAKDILDKLPILDPPPSTPVRVWA